VTACRLDEAPAMSAVYRQVFESYPFPIQDAGYLKQVMQEDACYYCLRAGDAIAALAAAEIDRESESAEMTDFATVPQWRRTGLAGLLLLHMEKEARQLGIRTAYTIARAKSPGINRLFNSNGYEYAGQLVNNTQIAGSIQSMNVWYKKL
jgi:putative beta-lysine N-acetyltransferase